MFKPMKTQKISDCMYVINSGIVNFYIYDTGDELLVFDTGMGKGFAKAGFKKLGLDYNRVTHVFLTHSDFDHISGYKLFGKAKVYLAEKETAMISGGKARAFGIVHNAKRNLNDFVLLADKEVVSVGNVNIQLIYTPGHTVGSSMYTINDSILVGGDTISIKGNKEVGCFSFVQNMDHKANVNLVQKLNSEHFFDKFSLIVTGHYGILKR